MRELETKLAFLDISEDELVSRLEAAGFSFGEAIGQTDFVYATGKEVVLVPSPGTVVARVRVESPGSPSLTVKMRRDSELDRTEHETLIDRPDEARACLELLGLSLIVMIQKNRRTAKAGDVASITVDSVVGLGVFVELEVLSDDAEADTLINRLREQIVLATGGTSEAVDKGYDRLLIERSDSSS